MTTTEQRELDERIERSIHDEEVTYLASRSEQHRQHYIETGISERDCTSCGKTVTA